MPRPDFTRRIALAAALAILSTAAHPQASPKAFNLVPNAPEVLGKVPDNFVWIRPGLQAAQDPVDGDLVFFNDEGHVVGRAALPPNFAVAEVVAMPSDIRLLDAAHRQQIVLARNIDPAANRSLQAVAVTAPTAPRSPELVRRGPQILVLRSESRAAARPLEIRSAAGGALASAYEIGAPAGSSRYVASEEVIRTTPSLQVRVFVQRYDRAGNLTGIANVPLDGMETVPHNFITITDGGRVRALAPTASGIKIRELEFSPPVRSRNGTILPRSMGRTVRELPVDTDVAKTPEQRSFRQGGPSFEVKAPTPPVSRDQILTTAQAYLTVNWVMTRANFSRAGIENRCDPETARFWLRPDRFTPQTIGQTIGPVPYRWGGSDTPKTFKARIEAGALAGSVCTCRDPELDYCLVPEAAGVDCSGLISAAWGIPKRGTSGLLDVATELQSLDALRPGDAFDWPGHHVRLLEKIDDGPALSFTVIEATTRRECEGVCERSYRPSELNGYWLIRYKGITQ